MQEDAITLKEGRGETSLSVSSLLKETQMVLDAGGIDSSQVEAELILAELLQVKRGELCLYRNHTLLQFQEDCRQKWIKQRLQHTPLQYILGTAPYRDLMLHVGPGVLIPRPETELIPDLLSPYLDKKKSLVYDVGSGSGAIALSIAQEYPFCRVIGIEQNEFALAYFIKNLRRYPFPNCLALQGDLLSSIRPEPLCDIIVANLPYITEEEYLTLDPEVKNFEPFNALVSGLDGLTEIRRLILIAHQYLTKEGLLLLEIGENQGTQVKLLLEKIGHYRGVEIIPDLNNRDRFVKAQL